MDVLYSNMDAVNLLVQQNIAISAMHATVTLRKAAQEQRLGHSMAFDEVCATQSAAPAIGFSRAQVLAGLSVAGTRPLISLSSASDQRRVGTSSQDSASDSSVACDGTLTSPAVTTTTYNSSPAQDECPDFCPCFCHTPSRDLQIVPSFLRPWIGRLNIPSSLPAVVSSSFALCDHSRCARGRREIQNIKYTAPEWFVHVEATIRFEAFPVHFCIRTPRVVPSLGYLGWISFDEFRIKLSTRELTLCDVDPDGRCVLHVSLWLSHMARTPVECV